MADVKAQFNELVAAVDRFFLYVGNKLKNFPNLTIGEQISYPAIGVGLLLILISIVLFIL